jgi:hypothetical protein
MYLLVRTDGSTKLGALQVPHVLACVAAVTAVTYTKCVLRFALTCSIIDPRST